MFRGFLGCLISLNVPPSTYHRRLYVNVYFKKTRSASCLWPLLVGLWRRHQSSSTIQEQRGIRLSQQSMWCLDEIPGHYVSMSQPLYV